MARTGIRASALIIKNNKVLLVHRKKNGEEYWVFPGGGVEDLEGGKEAVIREIKEETGLVCNEANLAFEVETFEGGNKHPFYFCDVTGENLKLGGPEAERQSENDWYNLEWVDVKQIKSLKLYPEGAKVRTLGILEQNGNI